MVNKLASSYLWLMMLKFMLNFLDSWGLEQATRKVAIDSDHSSGMI